MAVRNKAQVWVFEALKKLRNQQLTSTERDPGHNG